MMASRIRTNGRYDVVALFILGTGQVEQRYLQCSAPSRRYNSGACLLSLVVTRNPSDSLATCTAVTPTIQRIVYSLYHIVSFRIY
jgi:hypothetical protein